MSNCVDIIVSTLKEKMYRHKDNKMTIGSKIPTKPKEYTKEELEIKKELLKKFLVIINL